MLDWNGYLKEVQSGVAQVSKLNPGLVKGYVGISSKLSAEKRSTLHSPQLKPTPVTSLVVSDGGAHKLAPLSFRGATYSGVFTLLPILSGRGRKHHGEILQNARRLWDAGKLKVFIDATDFKLEDANCAYTLIENRKNNGKVVVSVE